MDASNLPLQLNSFVGRNEELQKIAVLVDTGVRLITVVGPGGIGKTRLVTEFARRQEASGKQVVFVDLTRGESVSSSLAHSVDMSSREVSGVLGALGARAELGLLLVVDNLEHLIDDAANMIPLLLGFPAIQILATSREPLRLAGEQVIRLSSLSESEALELFEVRAKAIVPEFESKTGREAILEVLERVDRLPLAIELAASRINVMAPEGLAERLTKRMSALNNRDRDRPERHKTVAATARWSWELLSASERSALNQLAAFHGAFRLADAERVIVLESGESAVDIVEDLVNRSMIERIDRTTFRLFQTIYGMAEQELHETSSCEEVYRRHAEHFVDLILRSPRYERGSYRKVLPDLRLAAERTQGELFIAVLAATASILAETGDVTLMLQGIVQAADSAALGEHAAELQYAAASGFLDEMNGPQALEYSVRAAASAEAAGHEELRCLSLITQGLALFMGNRSEEAIQSLETALTVARAVKSVQGEIKARSTLGIVLSSLDREPEAQEHVGVALERARSVGNIRVLSQFLVNNGVWHVEGHRWSAAIQALTESLELLRDMGDRRFDSCVLVNLGHAHAAQGQREEAREYYREASHVARDLGQLGVRLESLIGLGAMRETSGDRVYLVKAADLANTATAHREELMARSMLLLFDIQFASYPMAKHQARRLARESELPPAWRKVCDVLEAVISAWTGDPVETIALSQQPWVDTLVSACNEMITASKDGPSVSSHILAARNYLDELADMSLDQGLGFWPALHVGPVLRVMMNDRFGNVGANVLRLHPEGRFFAPPGAEVVDFSRRGALRGVLVGLAKARLDVPGKAVTLEEVLEMGWPGEIVTYEAGASRVYTAIRTLRSVGLGDVLQTSDEGYFFAPEINVVWDAELRR